MTTPYTEAINKPASKKVVFAKATFIKHFYAWILSGTTGIWYQSTIEPVERVLENDVEAIEVKTFAALVALSVITVGGWFYDESTERLYYKAVSGSVAFENFIVASIVFRFSQFPEEDATGRPHDPRVTSIPMLKLAFSQTFDSKAGQIGSGSMSLASIGDLFLRGDFEPDGRIDVTEGIE
jgi:hypothetical protein